MARWNRIHCLSWGFLCYPICNNTELWGISERNEQLIKVLRKMMTTLPYQDWEKRIGLYEVWGKSVDSIVLILSLIPTVVKLRMWFNRGKLTVDRGWLIETSKSAGLDGAHQLIAPPRTDRHLSNSPFPRCAMAANLVHCGIESGRKQNNGC